MERSPSTAEAADDKPVRLKLNRLSKTFGHTPALRSADLELRGGEVHALCGQNGSGKSTLIKILAAYHDPDPGAELTLDDESIKLPLAPGQPDRLGIRFVHQDLALAGDLSVLENLYVDGYPRSPLGTISWRTARRMGRETIARFGLDVPLGRHVDDLRPAQRAILAIARAMQEPVGGEPPARVLILDEPTAHLPADDVRRLMDAIGSARDHGVAVMIVTHRLEEVLDYADRATVLRDGQVAATAPVADLDHDHLVALLLGRSLDSQYPDTSPERGKPRFELRNFSTGQAEDVSLVLDEGEILGITGLIGSGFDDLPYGIFGVTPSSGEILFEDRSIRISNPTAALAAGLALVPAERIGQNGVSDATLYENLTLPMLQAHRIGPLLNRREEARYTAAVLERYDVRPRGPVGRPLSVLSGGNQQKLLFAKWLESKPQVLLLHEPTQGVDIGSRRQLFDLIVEAADGGCSILYSSADAADLASLCHRVLIFRRGRVIAQLHSAELNEDRIAELCLRDQGVPPAANGGPNRQS